MLEHLKEEVYKLHLELPKNNLVVWTTGNVSARDPESGLVVIKPSGVRYDELRPEDHVVVNLQGDVVEGDLKPSSDTPVYLTEMGDEFGCPIPCAGFALIGDEEIGRLVVEHIGSSPAVLLKRHGVFTVGPTAEAAVKAAVMTENVARTVWLALQLGQPEEIPPEDVAKLHHRYTHVYGQ